MSCTLGNDRKTHSYTQFSGFSGLFYCVYCIFNASFTTSTDLKYLSITFCKSPSCDKSCNTFKNLKFRFLNIQFPYVHHDALLLSLFCNECYIHQNKVRLSCFFDSKFSLSSSYFFWFPNKINHPPFSMKKFSMPWMHFVRFIFNLLSVEENNSNDFVLVSNLKHSFSPLLPFLHHFWGSQTFAYLILLALHNLDSRVWERVRHVLATRLPFSALQLYHSCKFWHFLSTFL